MSRIFTQEMIDERIKLHMEWIEGGYKGSQERKFGILSQDRVVPLKKGEA